MADYSEKRSHEENNAGNEKRSKVETVEVITVSFDPTLYLKVLVEPSECGKVLGKNGDILKQIASESGAKIRLSASDESIFSGERVASISGSLDQIVRAQYLVMKACVGEFPAKEKEADNKAEAAAIPDPVLKILVPEASTGSIIGKGGSIIKEMMATTSARIQLSQSSEIVTATNERIVSITGSSEARERALRAIYGRFTELPSESRPKQNDYSVLKLQTLLSAPIASNGFAGSVSGHGQSFSSAMNQQYQPPYQQQQSNQQQPSYQQQLPVQQQPPYQQPSPNQQQPPYHQQLPVQQQPPYQQPSPNQQQSPYPYQQPSPNQQQSPYPYQQPSSNQQQPPYQQPSSNQQQPPYQQPSPYQQQPPYQQQLPYQQPYQSQTRVAPAVGGKPRNASDITLPEQIVAGIIGKGGSIIRTINAQSGARVRMSQKYEVNERGERYVIFEGPPENCLIARSMVLDRIEVLKAEAAAGESGGSSNYGGGGGGGGYGRSRQESEYPPATANFLAQQAQQQAQYAQLYAQYQQPQGYAPHSQATYPQQPAQNPSQYRYPPR